MDNGMCKKHEELYAPSICPWCKIDNFERQLDEANDKFNRCNEARIQAQRESDHNKSMWDGSARRVALLESQLAEAKAEIDRLKDARYDLPRRLAETRQAARRDVAMECLEYLEDWGTGVQHCVKDGLKKHFKLEE